jgi:hypothetical protein
MQGHENPHRQRFESKGAIGGQKDMVNQKQNIV